MGYEVTAQRTEGWWSLEVTAGLPSDMAARGECRRLSAATGQARSLISDLLQIDQKNIQVKLLTKLEEPLNAKIAHYTESCSAEIAAQTIASRARRDAAGALLASGLTMRDAGEILGISHQRVKQLADEA